VNGDLVPDELWTRIASLLPPLPGKAHRYAGQRRTADRIALAGTVYVLRTGRGLARPATSGGGLLDVTAWRRL
jgi:transposase